MFSNINTIVQKMLFNRENLNLSMYNPAKLKI